MGQVLCCPTDTPRVSQGRPGGTFFQKAARQDMHSAIAHLVQQQKRKCQDIKEELQQFGKKAGHWIWWICPTEMPGSNDPYGTYVAKETAHRLFADDAAEKEWREVLEMICELLEKKGTEVFPGNDHGRILHFLKFWGALPNKPVWMDKVLQRMARYDWSPW